MSRTEVLLFSSIAGLLVLLLLIGCGTDHSPTPIMPDTGSGAFAFCADAESKANRIIWGLWDVYIPEDRSNIEVVPVRAGQIHLNLVRMLEETLCSDCLTIGELRHPEQNIIETDVTLEHPLYRYIRYTGFDVRGIFISGAGYTFASSGRRIALGPDLPMLQNPDGYTSLFNPTEFPPSTPPLFGYIQGKFATGGDLSATLNPFIAYCPDIPRRMFEISKSETRTFRIRLPQGPIHFGYAVDGCWRMVSHEINNPLTDFPPNANCLEPYRVSIEIPDEINSSWMSRNPINVEVFDHQGLDSISIVTVECPGLFTGEADLEYSGCTGDESWLYTGSITNELDVSDGEFPVLVKVLDFAADPNLGEIDAWNLAKVTIKDGWARTWGGTGSLEGIATLVDNNGDICIAGNFSKLVDFDPGATEDIHGSNGLTDMYLCKFDSTGDFIWARCWGGSGSDDVTGMDLDSTGCICVTGSFSGSVDFDPGTGVDECESRGVSDIFLCRFSPEGSLDWVRTWGGTEWDTGWGVACDSAGNIFVTGDFGGNVDFDPGTGTEYHESLGNADIFLSKFNSEGDFNWARTFGSVELSDERGRGVDVDSSGHVCVTGYFQGTADFDPGLPVDSHTSNGGPDVFLSRFDNNGSFEWARTWGGMSSDIGNCVRFNYNNAIYVSGTFEDTVDFDPGPSNQDQTSYGREDVFLAVFSTDSYFSDVRTWGGPNRDFGDGVAFDASDNVHVTGLFREDVDFDPGSGQDIHRSVGQTDAYLIRLDPAGSFVWARTWGGVDSDGAGGVSVGEDGRIFVTGGFSGEADFDPGVGWDIHQADQYSAFLLFFNPDGYW